MPSGFWFSHLSVRWHGQVIGPPRARELIQGAKSDPRGWGPRPQPWPLCWRGPGRSGGLQDSENWLQETGVGTGLTAAGVQGTSPGTHFRREEPRGLNCGQGGCLAPGPGEEGTREPSDGAFLLVFGGPSDRCHIGRPLTPLTTLLSSLRRQSSQARQKTCWRKAVGKADLPQPHLATSL